MTVICKENGFSLCSQLHVIQTKISQTFYHWGTSSSYFQIGMQMCVAEILCMLFLTAACDVSLPCQSVFSSESAPRRITGLHLHARGFWRDLQYSSAETPPVLGWGTPWQKWVSAWTRGGVKDCLSGELPLLAMRSCGWVTHWLAVTGMSESRTMWACCGQTTSHALFRFICYCFRESQQITMASLKQPGNYKTLF